MKPPQGPRRRTVLALAGTAILAACSTGPPGGPGDASRPGEPGEPGATRLAVVGDSITAADSPDLAGGVPGPASWVSYAVGTDVSLVGGWARWGARTAEMADAVAEPFEADVLAVLAGTNDAFVSAPHADVGAALVRLVENADVERVVLSSVPPIDGAPDGATALNAALAALAATQGWTWVDACAGLRDGDVFAAGMSEDGVHPTEAGARVLGRAIGRAVRAAAAATMG